MKNKILFFVKKYPLSILLGIIAVNLISISANLKDNSKLAYYKETCSRYFAFYAYGTDEEAEENEKITSKKLKVPIDIVDAYCQRIVRA